MCPNARSSKSQKYGREASFLRLLLPYLGGQGDRIPWRKQAKTMPESATTNLKDFLLWKPTLKRNLHPSSMLIMEICSTSGVCWKQDQEENHSLYGHAHVCVSAYMQVHLNSCVNYVYLVIVSVHRGFFGQVSVGCVSKCRLQLVFLLMFARKKYFLQTV